MQPFYCQVCRTALDVRTDSDHPDRVFYEHTGANLRLGRTGDPHEPLPVALADLDGEPVMCCDFCTVGQARWSYLTERISVVMGDDAGRHVHTEHYDPGWSACDECADIIDARKLGALVRRALAQHDRLADPAWHQMRVMLADLYRPLLANITGGRMPLAHTVDRGPQHPST